LFILFVLLNKNINIIKDCGYYKILIYSGGVLLYFISILFSSKNNYMNCSLKFIFKNIGIFTIFTIYLSYVILAMNLGLDKNSKNIKLFLVNSQASSTENINEKTVTSGSQLSINSLNSKHNNNNNNNNKIKENNQNIEIILNQNNFIETYNKNNLKSKNKKKEKLLERINEIHSTFVKVIFIYPLYVFSTLFFVIYYYINKSNISDNNIIQNSDGYWNYKCDLEMIDFTNDIIHFILVIILFINYNKIVNYECIFKIIKYIYYSMFIVLTMGPIINVTII